ncbi:MAG TPA: hypothetical protein VJU86_04915 [Pyrinomonadaceae bacterium]|nr:hypothetical protein [Pyrinomonadaceae bacterium]
MPRINWNRLLIGVFIVTIICFLSDGLLHEKLVGADWKAVYDNLGARTPSEEHSSALIYFLVLEVGRGFIAMLTYVLMRPFFSPGPKTAVLAGLVTWVAFSLTGPAQFIPLGFYSNALWMKVGAFQLVTSILGAIAGAAVYKDAQSDS